MCHNTLSHAIIQTTGLLGRHWTNFLNRAIFEKFYISNGPEDEFGVKLTFKVPYDQILAPMKDDISKINTAIKSKPEAVDVLADKAKGHIHDFFGCGPDLGQNKNPYSNESDYFNPNSSSKDLVVEHRGFEPLTSTMRTLRATNCANAPYSFRTDTIIAFRPGFVNTKNCEDIDTRG